MFTKNIELKRWFRRAIAKYFFFSFVISLIVICSVASATNSGTAPANETIGKWEVYEITLTTTNSYSNPYKNVALSATFNGPNEKEIIIEGFWAGGNTWKVRIAPTDVGTWTYTTTSNDGQLNGTTGTFEAVSPDKKGFVKVNPDHPYSFMYDDGTPFFWMGDTCWDDPGYTRFKDYIDLISSYGYNSYHTIVIHDRYDYQSNEGGAPFEMISSTKRDYDKLRPDFFKEFDKRVIYANSKEIIPQLYFTWSQEFVRFERSQFERFVRYMVARYAAYNVIWIISGEFEEESTPSEYAYHGNVLYQRDPYKHPISIHTINSNNEFGNDAWLTYIMHQTSRDVPTKIINDRIYNKPVVNAETQYLGDQNVDDWRKLQWNMAMAGGYFDTGYDHIFMDPDNHYDYFPPGWKLDVHKNLLAMSQMKYLYDFFSQEVDFWNMSPRDNLVTSGTAYCLANPGNEYVVYLPEGGSVTVDLSDATGTLNVEWCDPKDGTYYVERLVTGGGRERFTPPFTGDAVLHISTDIFPPRTTSVVTPTPNDAGWNNVTQVVVTFFRADNGTGISHTIYSKISETGPWTTVGTSAVTGTDAVNVTDIHEAFFNVTVLKEGHTEIWYYSVDNTSNIEHTKNVTVKIDSTSPLITIHSPENKTYITKTIPLNFTANEPLDTCLVSVDSTPNQTNCMNQSVISREYEAREGTVAWWHFNGDAKDTSGNNNHGTITGASFVDGKFGSALQFDGSNDGVSVNDSDSFYTIKKTITIEAWIKPVLTGNRTAIFYKESCFGFEITERENISFVLCTINASCQRFESAGIVKNNTWNHVAGTSDGITMRIYINGEQDPITNPAPARIYTSNYSAAIGIRQYGESSFDYPFNGDIEELRILNRGLSEEQIKSDYALGEGSRSVTVYGHDTAGNCNSSTVYFNIVAVAPLFDTGAGKYPSISGLHNGTLKPNQTITVYKMYTYPCPGTSGHSEYVRIYNESGTVAKGNWTGYEGDWHNISFDTPFILRANKIYYYTIRTGSYPQIIHARTAKVTGGTITCEEFINVNGMIYYDWIPAINFFC